MPLITTDLQLAISDLQSGKPVAIPTETVYGLAAKIDQLKAIKAVFQMKNRPLNHPLIVHVASDFDRDEFVKSIPDYAQKLIKYFWPGPLTLVLEAKDGVFDPLITGGQSTVAIRCPAHPIAQKLLQKLDSPLVAPSANPFGKISPTTALHVKHAFADYSLTILDGGRCEVGIESTIVDATQANSYKILRHGLLTEKAVAEVISADCLNDPSDIRVPGKLERHYQPQKKLYYFESLHALSEFCQQKPELVYVLATQKPTSVQPQYFYRLSKNPKEVAFDLYYQLRLADTSDATFLAIELPPAQDEWQGLRERILKAGSPIDSSNKFA